MKCATSALIQLQIQATLEVESTAGPGHQALMKRVLISVFLSMLFVCTPQYDIIYLNILV